MFNPVINQDYYELTADEQIELDKISGFTEEDFPNLSWQQIEELNDLLDCTFSTRVEE